MSIIRFGERGDWEEDVCAYAYPTSTTGRPSIHFSGEGTIPAKQYIEVTMRILERHTGLSDSDLEDIHETLQWRLYAEEGGGSE